MSCTRRVTLSPRSTSSVCCLARPSSGWIRTFFRGRLPFTLQNRSQDHEHLKRVDTAKPITYPQPDGRISHDLLSSVFLSSTNHDEDQRCHLQLADPDLPIRENLPVVR